MSTNYSGGKHLQNHRRHLLTAVRSELGDERFADFLVDILSEHAPPHLNCDDLGALCQVWLYRRRRVRDRDLDPTRRVENGISVGVPGRPHKK